MAQQRQLTWAELRVGIFVLVGLFVLAAGIFYVTAPGVFGPKYILKTFLPEVAGLTTGAPVELDGVQVGNVEAIKFVPHAPGQPVEHNRNVEVDMRVDERYQKYILTDSTASPVTEGLLGNRYINITRGYTGTPLKNGEEVKGVEEKAIAEVVQRSADLLGNLQALTQDAQDLIVGVKHGRGSLGKLLTDDRAYNHLNNILAKSDAMVGNIQAGKGSLGKIVASDEMYNKVDKALDNVDDIIANIRSGKGTLGKLLYDPTLYNQAKLAIQNSNSIIAGVRAGKGTLGRQFALGCCPLQAGFARLRARRP